MTPTQIGLMLLVGVPIGLLIGALLASRWYWQPASSSCS